MKQIFGFPLFLCTFLFAACGSNNNEQNENAGKDTTSVMATDTTTQKTYDVALVDNKKDPTCGMPTTAGISDTAHYENKVLGFCSSECKAEFLKNPKANIKSAELKSTK